MSQRRTIGRKGRGRRNENTVHSSDRRRFFFAAMTVWLTPSVFAAEPLRDGFRSPDNGYRPETWFHLCSRNITKVGITEDLEAIKRAGLRGIHLFSKGNDNPDRIWPNVKQVKTLSPEWYEAVRHAAEECKRLGLNFTLHNCPGWSQAGGPWVPIEESHADWTILTGRYRGKTLQVDLAPAQRRRARLPGYLCAGIPLAERRHGQISGAK